MNHVEFFTSQQSSGWGCSHHSNSFHVQILRRQGPAANWVGIYSTRGTWGLRLDILYMSPISNQREVNNALFFIAICAPFSQGRLISEMAASLLEDWSLVLSCAGNPWWRLSEMIWVRIPACFQSRRDTADKHGSHKSFGFLSVETQPIHANTN